MLTYPGAGTVGVVLGGVTIPQPIPPAPTTPAEKEGVQKPPEIRKWGYGGSVTAPKAQGPGGGIVLIGIGAVFLFMFTQKKRKKKR